MKKKSPHRQADPLGNETGGAQIAATRATVEPFRSPWSLRWRMVVSVLLMLHLLAVVSAPLAFESSSALTGGLAACFAPYQRATFLRQGYRFFSPEVGPSRLIRYELEMPDGKIAGGRFPNLAEQWPRQLYHRYFMLSEWAYPLAERVANPPQPPQSPPPPFAADVTLRQHEAYRRELQEYEAARASAEILFTGIARDLLERHNAKRVTLYGQMHLILEPEDVVRGRNINDESLFVDNRIGSYTAEGGWVWEFEPEPLP